MNYPFQIETLAAIAATQHGISGGMPVEFKPTDYLLDDAGLASVSCIEREHGEIINAVPVDKVRELLKDAAATKRPGIGMHAIICLCAIAFGIGGLVERIFMAL